MTNSLGAIHWAHIDNNGYIVSWGTAVGSDVFLQNLEPGLTAVARPADANPWDHWRYVNEEWIQETPS